MQLKHLNTSVFLTLKKLFRLNTLGFNSTPTTQAPLLTLDEIKQLIFNTSPNQPLQKNKDVQSNKMADKISAKKGAGMEFSDYRVYQQGDDPKQIDWRVSARSQHTLVKTYLAENQQSTVIVLDRQASMRFASQIRLKVSQALRQALLIASQQIQNGNDVRFIVLDNGLHFSDTIKSIAGLFKSSQQLNKPCHPINKSKPQQWQAVVSAIKYKVPIGSQVFILSDFASLKPQNSIHLALLGKHYLTTAIQVLDPLEKKIKPPFAMQLIWQKKTAHLHKSKQIKKLNQLLEQHRVLIKQLFKQANIQYQQILTSDN